MLNTYVSIREKHARFESLLEAEMSLENLHAIVDQMAEEIAEPAERNFEAWSDYPPRGGSFQGEVDILKLWLERRHNWISGCIADKSLSDPMYCTGN